jgi:hypothetical protein
MEKRLTENDYQKIVFESFGLPEHDLYNHYLNIVEKNHHYNPNIILRLKMQIENWISWHWSEVHGGNVVVKFDDGTTDVIDKNQTWRVDENGERIYNDLDKTGVPLYGKYGFIRQVDRAYFDYHLKALNLIQVNIYFRQKILEFEQQLPEPLKTEFEKNPMPDGFDYIDLESRWRDLKQKQIPEWGKDYSAKNKPIPSLPEIFKSKDYFDFVISKTKDYWKTDRDSGKYHWKKAKACLAGLAIQLRAKNRLENLDDFNKFNIENNQDLGRAFCSFFNMKYDEKTFQPDRIKPDHKKPFSFITDF